MALTLGDNFSYQGAKPLDARLKYDTLAAMKAVADATMYDGCMAYCSATDKTYQWKSSNTVDETLGKWREFSSGGGGGTDYTAGDGIDITEDVISVDPMPSEDMDEVISPLPSTRPSRSTILKQVLEAGETEITFNNIPTTGDYIVEFFNSLGVNYTLIEPTTGSCTLTYNAQDNDMDVYCEIREV